MNKAQSPALDFAVFLETWNAIQNMQTPQVHCRIADWLQACWDHGDTKMLLMAFRSCGKSTLVGLFCAWLLWRDQNLRILVLAAESNLAGKMVRNIKKIIERHPFTKNLKPNNPDQWAADRFTIKREAELRDPSVLGAGIAGNITGSRADLIIYDDVEVPNTSRSSDLRQDLRERVTESQFVLTAGGRQIFVGTPHTYFSIYADVPRMELDEETEFLTGFKRLEVPIIDDKGQSAWPERYPIEAIDAIKAERGPNKFQSQMMLQPINVVESRLNTGLLQFYEEDISEHIAQNTLQIKIGETKMVSCSAWWDPAFGAAKGDSSVLAIVFSDDKNRRYLHHLEYITVHKTNEKDEASQQCDIIANLVMRYFVPRLAIETNGIGTFLPGTLKQVFKKLKVPCAILPQHNKDKKSTRILEAYDALMAAKSLYVHRSVRATPYLMEMAEWQEAKTNNKDDGLDAVAGALSLEPMRFHRIPHTVKTIAFSGGGRAHRASADFDV
ncbi:MAG: phage terminase large subunit [Alphaproteobacteria bacterium]|nr:phage terminase large subunit [Alphaproteobacteria bacterium]NCQ87509.1 phage terminase large subunit [Alphaproteobacteria bacterium]NCT06378.1 phage terminase large subunit [Alphaproteobacteria bacterium]